MYYYKFDKNNIIYKKYKNWNGKAINELKPVYEYIKQFNAKYIYKFAKKVMGFILPHDSTEELKERFEVKEARKEGLLVYPKRTDDKQAINKKLKYTDARIKKALFGCNGYFGFILAPDALYVESLYLLDNMKDNESTQADFMQVVENIRKVKGEQTPPQSNGNTTQSDETVKDEELPIK